MTKITGFDMTKRVEFFPSLAVWLPSKWLANSTRTAGFIVCIIGNNTLSNHLTFDLCDGSELDLAHTQMAKNEK